MSKHKLRILICTYTSPEPDELRCSKKSLDYTDDGDIRTRYDQNGIPYIICEKSIDYDGDVDNARKVAIKYINRLAALSISRYGYRFVSVSVIPNINKSYLVMYGSDEIMTSDLDDEWRGSLTNNIYNIGTVLYRKYISRLIDSDIKDILDDIK